MVKGEDESTEADDIRDKLADEWYKLTQTRQAIEAYCITNKITISEAVRGMITSFVREHKIEIPSNDPT